MVKLPEPPPTVNLSAFTDDVEQLTLAWASVDVARDRYLSWSEMSYRRAPDGLTREQWWAATQVKRRGAARVLPLRQVSGDAFWYTLPDEALRRLDSLATRAGGSIGMREPVTNPETRNQYLVRGLMEEAITSSQLEGATTTRRVAKEMLRSGRSPVTKDERMIWNNYAAMTYVQDHRHEAITPEGVMELHSLLVEGTLEDPADAGRLQTVSEERVHVGTDDGTVVHRPPEAETLPGRLQELCAFASNEDEAGSWLPPTARAIFVHFMAGHDHYFVDGNGRLARTLFYWVMLREGLWLTEYATISTILKKAPVKYALSYVNSEHEGDATFFLLYQLGILDRAFDDLETYLERQTNTTEAFKRQIRSDRLGLNQRQVAILERAIADSSVDLTMASHSRSHRISAMTARADLHGLEDRGLLMRVKQGRQHHWWPARDLPEKIAALNTSPR